MNVAEKMNWNFRPIKRLGPAKWLIASEKTAPTQVALIEDQAVLVTEVRPKDIKQQQVILTDPQHKKQVPQKPLLIWSADPWQSGADPWAQHGARSTGSQPKIPVPAPRQGRIRLCQMFRTPRSRHWRKNCRMLQPASETRCKMFKKHRRLTFVSLKGNSKERWRACEMSSRPLSRILCNKLLQPRAVNS